MSAIEFIVECSKRSISPDLALENEDIKQALLSRNDQEVKKILDNQF